MNSQRIMNLREEIIKRIPKISIEKARITTESYKEFKAEPVCIKRAKTFRKILKEMSISIQPDELIVGGLVADNPRGAQISPEYSIDWIEEEIDRFDKRDIDPFLIDDKDKEELKNLLLYWRGKTVKSRALSYMPEIVKKAMDEKIFINPHDLCSGIGHTIPDYEKVLNKGLEGICSEIKEKLSKLKITNPEDFKKFFFLKACLISCEAAIEFAKRYSILAREISEKEKNPRRKKELLKISDICKKIPAKPAETFHEAIQSFWFIHLLVQIESNGHSISPGRFDQYMYKFYKNDKISKEEAQELIDCLWVKFNEIVKFKDRDSSFQSGGYPVYQNPIVGGQTPDGLDATNEITYMCMEAEKNVRLPQPSFSIRYDYNVNTRYFLKRACEVIKLGTGKPAIFNDKVFIDALLIRGVKIKDARNYAIAGCVEGTIPAKTQGAHGASKLNLAKSLELALNNGVNPSTNNQVGPTTGDPLNFSCFSDLLNAFKKQVEYFVKLIVIEEHAITKAHSELAPVPFLSSLIDNCIDNGKDVMDGGAEYNFIGPEGIGTSTVADSLASIKKLCFEDKTINLREVLNALKSNFVNQEPLRQKLLNCAKKFGNDDDYVDLIAREVGVIYCKEVGKYRTLRGGSFSPGLYPASAHVPMGKVVGATPDGRKSGEPLNEGVSPVQGRDIKGPTAAMKSVSKLDHILVSNGTLLNMKFNPNDLRSSEDLSKFEDLIISYFISGGMHVQFNVISAETLRDAQKHPENYRDLVIRVAGYSAFFNALNRPLQDEIISRTEHEI